MISDSQRALQTLCWCCPMGGWSRRGRRLKHCRKKSCPMYSVLKRFVPSVMMVRSSCRGGRCEMRSVGFGKRVSETGEGRIVGRQPKAQEIAGMCESAGPDLLARQPCGDFGGVAMARQPE